MTPLRVIGVATTSRLSDDWGPRSNLGPCFLLARTLGAKKGHDPACGVLGASAGPCSPPMGMAV